MDPPIPPPPPANNQGMLAVDLTEDANANQPIPCGRQKVINCSKLIQPEDERHYILDKNDLSGKGTLVCSACYQYYETKRGTLRATYVGHSVLTARIPSHQGPSLANSHTGGRTGVTPTMQSYYAQPQSQGHNTLTLSSRGQMLDTSVISKAVNQAKRSRLGGSHAGLSQIPQQLVTPLPHVIAGASGNPAFGRPFQMPGAPAMMSMAMPAASAALGYSQNHGVYHSERSRQSKKAYANQALSLAGNTINLIVQFGREVQAGGKTKLQIINGIQEGCDHVPVDSNITQLCALVHNTLEPRIRQFLQGFALNIKTLPIRNIPGWVDLTAHRDPTSAFYYDECHVPDKKGIFLFKKPRLPFTLALVMTSNQWEDFQTYLEHQETRSHRDHSNLNRKGNLSLTSTGSATVNLKVNQRVNPLVPVPLSESQAESKRRKKSTASAMSDFGSSESEPELVTPGLFKLTTGKETSTLAQPQKKRRLEEASSSTSQAGSRDLVRTPSPPSPLAQALLAKDAYTSPDRLRLREALMSGGEMDFKVVEKYDPPKNIDYYDIEPKPLDVLMELEPCNQHFSIEYKNALRGTLAINNQHWLGQGAAKTTHSAILSIFNAPSSSSHLGRKPNESVVAKRFYVANDHVVSKISMGAPVPKEAKITRYSFEDERKKVEAEANLLYWADSLMSLANSWIQVQIAQRTDPCPLTIPQLRFVHGGVALVHGAYHTHQPGKLFYHPNATYLIEELIPSALGPFTKYVHNVDATPQLPSFEGPAYEIAEFLCFVQHLQYWKTGAMVYISDFQGAGHLLTDPQIMTNPSFGKFLFGYGNIMEAFNEFPVQHMCNKYCEWFKLPSLQSKLNVPVHIEPE